MSALRGERFGVVSDQQACTVRRGDRSSFESVAEILSGQGLGSNTAPRKALQTAFPAADLSSGISKHKLNQLQSITLVRAQREKGRQEIGYQARPFVLCGIPLRRPPATQLVHRRQNGKFFLEIVAHPSFGLPTVRADCTCAPLAFGMGRNISSLPPAAWSAI